MGLLSFSTLQTSAHNLSPLEKISRARVFADQAGVQIISQLGICTDHGFRYPGYFIENEFVESDLDLLRAHGFSIEILVDDVIASRDALNDNFDIHKTTQALFCGQNVDTLSNPQNFNLGSFAGYFTYDEMNQHLDLMATLYSELIGMRSPVSSSGITTWEGRELEYVLISDGVNSGGNEPQILFNALHHAREPLSMQQLIYTMWYILENYQSNNRIKYLVDNAQIYFIPCVNPDGYVHDQTIAPNGGGFWRKNKRDNNLDGQFDENDDGVDLNRNYGYEWGYNDQGSSPNPSSAIYRGIAGFSEPETASMREFVIDRNIQFVYNYHTYGNLLIAPYGYDEAVTLEDTIQYYEYAQYVTALNGYTYGPGTATVGYTVNGNATDYMYGEDVEKNKIFSFTPEVGQVGTGFYPPMSEIYNLCRVNVAQNIRAIEVLLESGKVVDTSPRILSENDAYLSFEFTRLGMADGPIDVEFIPLSSNIQNVGPSDTYNAFFPGVTITDSVAYTLDPGTQAGSEIKFLVSVFNGHYYMRDTLRKIYGPVEIVFEETGNLDDSDWPITQDWSSTTEDFYSPPASITDSPFSDMNSGDEILESRSIDLTEASNASLRFMCKWNIASRYDYIQVLAAKESDMNFVPLCGKYTKVGSDYQADGTQVYDGFMFDWVQEEMNLDDFVGENVIIKFVAESFSGNTFDGFFFDDLEVWIINENEIIFQPIAVDDEAISNDNESIVIPILANDNLSGNLDTTITILSAPNNGIASIDVNNQLNYIPNMDNINDTDSMIYEVCNSVLYCDQAVVRINLNLNTSIENNITEISMFELYPNPSIGQCTISYTGENLSSEYIEIKVSTADGKVLMVDRTSNQSGPFEAQLDLQYVAPGLYFVQVSSRNKIIELKKLIVL